MDKVVKINSIAAYIAELGEDGSIGTASHIIKNGDIGLVLVRGDITPLNSIEILGTYEQVFADAALDAKYKEVYAYDVPIDITEEDGTITQYCRPKKFIEFSPIPNSYLKQNARDRIEREVGDDKDLLADISKRLALTERLLMRLTHELIPQLATDSYVATNYGEMIAGYVQMVDGGFIKDRVDYEDPASVFTELTNRTNKIGWIVNEEYLSKKK